jgi:hypothetical protein
MNSKVTERIADYVYYGARRPVVVSTALAAALIAAVALPRVVQQRPPIGPDAFIFEYGGWLIANGGKMYVTFWEIKPPGPWYITGALAFVTGDNMLLLHRLSVLISAAGILASVASLTASVHRVTDLPLAGLIAGISYLAYPTVYALPATGYRPKTTILAVAFGAWYLYLIDRPRVAFAVAMLAPALWQFGLIIPLTFCAVGLLKDRLCLRETVGIAGAITAVTVVPVIITSGYRPMFIETILVPLTIRGSESVPSNILFGGVVLASAAPIGFIGGLEAIRRLRDREHLLVSIPFVWFAFQAMVLDLDGAPDLLLVYGYAVAGLGLLAARLSSNRRQQMFAAVCALVLASIAIYIVHPNNPHLIPPAGTGEFAFIDVSPFWEPRFPESCHIRLSETERVWMEKTSEPICE